MIELPEFDTGQYQGFEFLMSDADAILTVNVHGLAPFKIQFRRVRWHEFTAIYNCTASQIENSYFRLHEVNPSTRLRAFLAADSASAKAYKELHHYRIVLDESGCHELFAESARTVA